tara:strand:+ start:2212 stop:2583 length:372 start_codon:yes stop_codon:yes gene_type:complete
MRTKGSATNALCWECKVINQDQVIHEGKYKTLKDMATDIGYSYNQVVELSSGRRKKHSGKYDSTYLINKIVNKNLSQIDMIKLGFENKVETNPEVNMLNIGIGDINPSMNGFGEIEVISTDSS